MGSYKKIGLSHEMGLIDTPPFNETLTNSVVSFEQPAPVIMEREAPILWPVKWVSMFYLNGLWFNGSVKNMTVISRHCSEYGGLLTSLSQMTLPITAKVLTVLLHISGQTESLFSFLDKFSYFSS